jgi:hypothetical protein
MYSPRIMQFCAHLPREERATRDVTFGPLCNYIHVCTVTSLFTSSLLTLNHLNYILEIFQFLEECTKDEFLCGNNQCVSNSLKCDGYDNCDDKTDEEKETAECGKAWLFNVSYVETYIVTVHVGQINLFMMGTKVIVQWWKWTKVTRFPIKSLVIFCLAFGVYTPSSGQSDQVYTFTLKYYKENSGYKILVYIRATQSTMGRFVDEDLYTYRDIWLAKLPWREYSEVGRRFMIMKLKKLNFKDR